jgi:hypothetical protein
MDAEVRPPAEEKLPRLDNYFWAIALILAGVFFGADSLGILPRIGAATTWTWVLLGAGILSLGLSLYASSSESYSNPTTWDWIFGALIFALGLGGFLGVDIALPVVLIVLGAASLLGLFSRRT